MTVVIETLPWDCLIETLPAAHARFGQLGVAPEEVWQLRHRHGRFVQFSMTLSVTLGYMRTGRFSISARKKIHDRIRVHAEPAAVDVSTCMIAAAVQQMIRDDGVTASFAAIDTENAAASGVASP
ncbi:MAG TPA: hypothetical protein VKV80_06780 [Streptosporangiaceae bacterium]|nr:hypothetical protein [Streptosporangiaceae bacterium]